MDPAQIAEEALVVALVVSVAVAVIVGFVTWLLLRAADKPPGSMVTLSLTLLTIFAIGVYAVTREEVMAAVVGTGLGALAGAVTSLFKDAPPPRDITSSDQENDPDEGTPT